MTTEQLKQNGAAMLAFAEGKQVEARSSDGSDPWTVLSNPNWTFYSVQYRPKPEPVSRPWNCPADVPGPVCWVREYRSSTVCMIVGMSSDGFSISTGGNYKWSEFTKTEFEYSTDRKEWKKCEVTEPAQ